MHPFRVGSPEADEATLQALARAGSDLTRETEVIFYLYFPTPELAARAAEAIRNPTFVPAVKDKLCEVTARIVPSLNTIRDASVRFHAVAATLHGQYDGWVAQVQPGQEPKPLAPPPVSAAIKWWVALRMYVMGPVLLYRTHRLGPTESRILLAPDDEHAMPAAIRTYVNETEEALAALGFTNLGRTTGRRSTAGSVTSYATLLEHPERHTMATIIATQTQRGRTTASLVFKNALTDGRVVLTSNSSLQRRFPRRPGYDAISFPNVTEPADLDRVHRFRVGEAPVAPITAAGDAPAYFVAEEADSREAWLRAGYYRRMEDGAFRLTRFGALCMAWRGKFPWAQLTRWRDARQRAAVYSRLGS
jgi:hypothetical protein